MSQSPTTTTPCYYDIMNTEYHYGTVTVKLNCIANSVCGYTGLSQFYEYSSTGCNPVEP